MPTDDELDRLLELADGERPLPGDLEDRLLSEILETAGGDPAMIATGSDNVVTSPGRPDHAAPTTVVDLLRNRPGAARPGRRRLVLTVAAAVLVAAVALAVATIVRDGGDPDTGVTAGEGSGAEATPTPTPVSVFDDERLCSELDVALTGAGLVGQVVIVEDLDPAALETASRILAEMAVRPTLADAATAAAIAEGIVLIDNAVLEMRRGTVASEAAAHRAARESIGRLVAGLPDDQCLP